MRYNNFFLFLMFLLACACEGDKASEPLTTGQGGSMTRFAISGDRLYVVDRSHIKVFNASTQDFKLENEVSVDPGIETLFAKGEFLYLGTTSAMYIFSIAEPSNPTFVFRYEHVYSCDPVVVQGNRAYVTMLAGGRCGRGTSALEVLDISDPYNPALLLNYPMTSPRGLGIDGDLLFVCDGDQGLKVFNAKDDRNLILLKSITSFSAYDVILRNGIATITGEDGIFQYSYSSPSGEMTFRSEIPVTRTQF